MKKPNILVCIPRGPVFDTFFDEELMAELAAIGPVEWNLTGTQYTQAQLRQKLPGVDICVTGWGSPMLDADTLAEADSLRLVAHLAGSIKPYVTDAVYQKGARVCSGNRVFAKSVAEGVIAYALASLRRIPYFSAETRAGRWPQSFENRGLLGRSVGIVGFGMIAEYLAEMLGVFGCPVKVFSRHISDDTLQRYGMQKADLPEIFATCDVVSLHSGMTPENHHLVTEALLDSMKQGALLVNTARGAVIDEAALARVLERRPDITAALDVYETEPLPQTSPLLQRENTLLMPHMGGPTIDQRRAVTRYVMQDMRRFLEGQPLGCEIEPSRAAKMSAF